MMTKVYDFGTQLDRGKFFEQHVDAYVSEFLGQEVTEASMDQERIGIDRIWKSRSTGAILTAEIKADEQGQRTGNAFIETVSVERDGLVDKYGWAMTSYAQVLAYYLPLKGQIIFVDMPTFKRRFFQQWFNTYPSREIKNKTYVGHGTLLPLRHLEDMAFHIGRVDHGE
jgi:hypothetical protein